MKNILKYLIFSISLITVAACQDDWLDREPQSILIDEQIWNDPKSITGLLANYYDRLPYHFALDHFLYADNPSGPLSGWPMMAAYTDALWSGQNNQEFLNNVVTYGFDWWRLWDYGLIRDINLAIDNIEQYSTELDEAQKRQFSAEFRFLRASVYFDHVKRMGGVPLVTEQLIYDFSGNATELQIPRSTEAGMYDFIASELDAIMDDLGNEGSQTRANRFTALALKSRAMLYAGSIAKYNNLMGSPITTPGGEVGIPADRATQYYTAALEASREIINNGPYTLYQNNPDLGENFYEAVSVKTQNNEVIWAQDFLLAADKRHWFSYDNIPRSIREDNLSSSSITPSLNLVEDYDYLDGSSGELRTRTADDSDYIYYDNPEDIFANKDARLYGTVIYPGSTFKGQEIVMQAGVAVWNAETSTYDFVESGELGSTYEDGGLLTGPAGPSRTVQEVSNTGFYIRKYLDRAPSSATRGVRSDTWWVRFRLGEIYLNAAEAAFELGLATEAVGYINTLRERAGFGPNSLTEADLTIDRIRNERHVELAFEDHRLWDLKRWRIAHEVWNGNASNPEAVVRALYPYRVIRPGHPNDGKYIFVKLTAPRFASPRLFQLGNYYSSIDQNVLNNNPKLVRNPFH